MKNLPILIICFLIAPLMASVGFGFSFWFTHPNDFYKLIESKGMFHMFGPNIYVTPVAYGITLIFGAPTYLVLKRLDLDKALLIILSGSFIGLFLSYFFRFGSKEWQWESGLFPALFVSATAVLILELGRNVQSKI